VQVVCTAGGISEYIKYTQQIAIINIIVTVTIKLIIFICYLIIVFIRYINNNFNSNEINNNNDINKVVG